MSHGVRVRLLLRALLKAGRAMPDANRRAFVRRSVRVEFNQMKVLSDELQIREALVLGETHLDSIRIAANSLAGTRKRVRVEQASPDSPWIVAGVEFETQSEAVQYCEANGIDYQVVRTRVPVLQRWSRFD